MSIQPFSFPVPETRFFQAGQQVFKFRIRPGHMNSIDEEDMLDEVPVNEELENALRSILANLDGLQPFSTQHFNIFPYKSKWERVSKMRFMREGVKLSPYPYLITLYVEYREGALTNTNSWNTSETLSTSKSPRRHQPMRAVQAMAEDHPEDGAVSQNKQNEPTRHSSQCFEESPCSANGAEAMVCGSEIQADSDMSCLSAADVYDDAPQSPDPNSAAGQNMGIITRMVSSLFPISLFFRKSPAN